jgi:hypothetical protein
MSTIDHEPENGESGTRRTPEQERRSALLLGIVLLAVFGLMAALVGIEVLRPR